jgi:ABC-2 type transport system ATP-binding protein
VSILCGHKDNKRIDELLEIVGLSDDRNMKVKKFSLGMKQRLGLAMVLLPSPHLLVLDEPLNGLDPNGIIEMREIIGRLKKDDVTILISSHILSELSKVADDFIFIKKGKIVRKLSGNEITDLESLYREICR